MADSQDVEIPELEHLARRAFGAQASIVESDNAMYAYNQAFHVCVYGLDANERSVMLAKCLRALAQEKDPRE